jgi:hypothetical protein
LDFRLSEKESGSRSEIFSFICSFLLNPKSKIQNSFDDLVRRASTFGGIVRPICFAAFRLMMKSRALFAAQHRRKNRYGSIS